MLVQAFAVSGSVTVALVGLVASNLLYDRGVANSLSRYVAPIFGGVAFLVAVLWLDVWTATVLAGAMALFILAVRLGFRRGLRGVRGNLPNPGLERGDLRPGRNGRSGHRMGPAG